MDLYLIAESDNLLLNILIKTKFAQTHSQEFILTLNDLDLWHVTPSSLALDAKKTLVIPS
jgi:hypothetical protein